MNTKTNNRAFLLRELRSYIKTSRSLAGPDATLAEAGITLRDLRARMAEQAAVAERLDHELSHRPEARTRRARWDAYRYWLSLSEAGRGYLLLEARQP